MAVSIAASRMATQIAVEIRADMPQFVNQRDQLLTQGMIHEARQVDAQHVQHLQTLGIEHALHAVTATPANAVGLAAPRIAAA